MTKRTKLATNPCPFCGYLAPHVLGWAETGKGYQIECHNCGARGPVGWIDEEAAAKAWDYGDPPHRRPKVEDRGHDLSYRSNA